jgi:hypothetical protein
VTGTLGTDYENGDTVDGVVMATGDRILIKNQSTQTENGIYTVNISGAPTRATDADTGVELEGAAVSVTEGTSNANTTWNQTTDSITLGVSNIVWGQFGSSVPDASASTKGIAKLYNDVSGTNTDGAADQNSVKVALDLKAPLASPTFTGTPTAPTASVSTDTTQISTTEFVQENKKIQTVDVTGTTYTLLLTDAFKKLKVDNAAAVTVTVPLASSVDFEIGTMILVNWYGVCGGATVGVTIAATGGVTIHSSSTGLTIQSRYSTVVLEKIGTNEWNLYNGTPPTLLPIVVDVNMMGEVLQTVTNAGNVVTGLSAYTQFDLSNYRQIRVKAHIGVGSASVNSPRFYLRYSLNDGSSYTVLGQGTIASGEAIDISSAGWKSTVWYDIPVGAKQECVLRLASDGGDGVADPQYNNVHIELKQ